MKNRRVRVTVEEIDEDGDIVHRTEVSEQFGGKGQSESISAAIGIAASGAISGMCVYDDASISAIFAWLMWRTEFEETEIKAFAEALHAWLTSPKEMDDFDHYVRVMVCDIPGRRFAYATECEELPERDE